MSDPIPFYPNRHIRFAFGDITQVRSQLVRYELGGVHSVVNVMAGQYAENKSISEETLETEFFQDATMEDTATTSRSESTSETLRSATQSTVSDASQFEVAAAGKANFGLTKVSASAGYGTQNAKTQSRSDSRTAARQLVESATESVRRSVSTSSREKRISRQVQEEVRGLDNRGGPAGAFLLRYLDEIHEFEAVQHGKHLFTRFVIPDPAAHWKNAKRLLTADRSGEASTIQPLSYYDPFSQQHVTLSPAKVSPANWFQLATLFEVSDPLPPPARKTKIVNFVDDELENGNEPIIRSQTIEVPDGYRATFGFIESDFQPLGDSTWETTTVRVLAGKNEMLHKGWMGTSFNPGPFPLDKVEASDGTLELGLVVRGSTYGVYAVEIWFDPTDDELTRWQFEFYQQLVQAHGARFQPSPVDQFDLISIGDFSGNPAAAKRMIESEIERLCLQFVLGSDLLGLGAIDRHGVEFPNYPAIDYAKAGALQSIYSFLANIFDFEKMSYRMLPHYLGTTEARENAYALGGNALLDEFEKAGAVEVLLPVSRGLEEQLLYFMQTGLVIDDDDIPLPYDPEMLSLYDEIVEARAMETDTDPEVIDRWEETLPTHHIMLQDGAALPEFTIGGVNPGPVTGNTLTPGNDSGGE